MIKIIIIWCQTRHNLQKYFISKKLSGLTRQQNIYRLMCHHLTLFSLQNMLYNMPISGPLRRVWRKKRKFNFLYNYENMWWLWWWKYQVSPLYCAASFVGESSVVPSAFSPSLSCSKYWVIRSIYIFLHFFPLIFTSFRAVGWWESQAGTVLKVRSLMIMIGQVGEVVRWQRLWAL